MSNSNLHPPLQDTINSLIDEYKWDIECLRDAISSASWDILKKIQIDELEKALAYLSNDDLSESDKKIQEKAIAKEFVDFHKNSDEFPIFSNDNNKGENQDWKDKKYNQFSSILVSTLKSNFDLPLQNKELPIYVYLEKIFKHTTQSRVKDLFYWSKSITKIVVSERWKETEKVIIPDINQNTALLNGLVKYESSQKWNTDIFEEKFTEKLDRYYKMYESVLAKRIQTDMLWVIEENSSLWLEQLSAIFKEKIKNLLDEFLYVMYAFWDKISVTDLDRILQGNDIPDDNKNSEQRSEKRYTSIVWFTSNITSRYEKLKWHPELVTLYRTFAQDGVTVEEWKRIFSNSLISWKIEDHFWESLDNLLDIYKHWFYSASCSEENLDLIKQKIDILFEWIEVLHNNNIAFTSHNYNPKDNVKYLKKRYWDIINSKLKKNLEKEMFDSLLLDKIWNSEIITNITEKRSDDLIFTETKGDLPSYSNVTFDELGWKSTLKRKEYFLEEIIELTDDKKTITKNHKLFDIYEKNSKEYESFIKFYAKFYEKHWNSDEHFKNLFDNAVELIEKWDTTLKYFEESRIPYEQILVWWFRYTLMYKKYSWEYDDEKLINAKITEEFDAVYGNSHLIMSYLDDDIVESNNVQIISWSINNSHVWTIEYMCEKWDKWHSKRWKDLKNGQEFWFEREKEWWEENEKETIKFNTIESLYLPQDMWKSNVTFDDIRDYNKWFLEFCNLDLQKENIPEKFQKYRKVLTDNGIDILDHKIITDLRKFYKYTLSLSGPVQKMYDNANENAEFLNELQSILHDEWIKITIGWSKSAYRTFQKWICDYKGDIRMLQDLLRWRNVEVDYLDSIENVAKVIETLYTNKKLKKNVLQVLIWDNTWNPSERSEKPTWYRDLWLDIKLASWNVVELQFQLQWIYDFKEIGLEPEELVKIFQDEWIKLTKKQYLILEENALKEGLKIPHEFKRLCWNKHHNGHSSVHGYATDSEWNQNTKITSTWFYNMWRWVKDIHPEYVKKIQRMESLPNLIAWWKVVHNLSEWILEKKAA